MAVKIIRGAVIGIILGVILGVGMLGSLRMQKIIDQNDQLIASSEQNASSVFNMDDYVDPGYSVPALYISDGSGSVYADGYDSACVDDYRKSVYADLEAVYTDTAGATDAVYDVNDNPPECTDLQDIILRFHVRANSNSEEDIALKYTVRDAVLTELGGELTGDKSREEVMSYLNDNLDRIEKIALDTIHEEGYDYTVKVYIADDYFPIRQYGELVLPAGVYQALRVDIGLAEGENFWCILYPMMCYTVDSGAVISKGDEEKLEDALTEEQFKKLFVDRDVEDNDIEVRFKLLEWLGL